MNFTDYINMIKKKKNYENNHLINGSSELNNFNLKNYSYMNNNLSDYIKNTCKYKMDITAKKKSIYFYKDRKEENVEISSKEDNLNICEKSKKYVYDFTDQYLSTHKENALKKKSKICDKSENYNNLFYNEIGYSEKSSYDYSNFKNEKEEKNLSRKSFYSIYDYTDDNDDSNYQIIKKNKVNNIIHKKSCSSCYFDKTLTEKHDNNYFMHIYDSDYLHSNHLIMKSNNKSNNKEKNKNKKIKKYIYRNKSFNRKKEIKKDLVNKIVDLVKYYKIYNAKAKFHYIGIIAILKKYIYVIKNNNIIFFKKKLNKKKILLISKIKKRYNSCNTFYFIQKRYLYRMEVKQKKNKCLFFRYLYFCKLKKKLQNYYRKIKIKREKKYRDLMRCIKSQFKKNYFFNEYIDCRLKDEFNKNKNKNIISKKYNSKDNEIKKYLMYCFQNNIYNFKELLNNKENYKKIRKYKKNSNIKNYANYEDKNQNEQQNYEKRKNNKTKKKKINNMNMNMETKLKSIYKEGKNMKENNRSKNKYNKKKKKEFGICLDCKQLYMNYMKDTNQFYNLKNGLLSDDINKIKKIILSRKEETKKYLDTDESRNSNENTGCKSSIDEKKKNNNTHNVIKRRNHSNNVKNESDNDNNNEYNNNFIIKNNNSDKVENVKENNKKVFNSNDNSKNIDNDGENNKDVHCGNRNSILNISIENINSNIIEKVNNENAEKINNENSEKINNNGIEKINSDKNKNISYDHIENSKMDNIGNNNNNNNNNNNIVSTEKCTYMNENNIFITLEESLENEMKNNIDNFSINRKMNKIENSKKDESTYENEENSKDNQKDTHIIINDEMEIEAKMEIEIKKSLEEIIKDYISDDIINEDIEFRKMDQTNMEEKNNKEKDIKIEENSNIILSNHSFSMDTQEQDDINNCKVESISNFFYSFQNINSEYLNVESKKMKKKKKVKKENEYQQEKEDIIRKIKINENFNRNFKTSKNLYYLYYIFQNQVINEFKKGYLKEMKKIFKKKCKQIEKSIFKNTKSIANYSSNINNINDDLAHICKKKKKQGNSQRKKLKNEIKVEDKNPKFTNDNVNNQIINNEKNGIINTDNLDLNNKDTKKDSINIQHNNSHYNLSDYVTNNTITYKSKNMDYIYKSYCDVRSSLSERNECNEIYKKEQNEQNNIASLLNINKKNIYKKQNFFNSKKNYINENSNVKMNILRNNSLIDLKEDFTFKNSNSARICNSIKNDLNNKMNVLKYLKIIKKNNTSNAIIKKINDIWIHQNQLNNKINNKNYVNEFIHQIKKKSAANKKLYKSTKERKNKDNKKKKIKNIFRRLELYKKKDIIKINKLKINKKIHSINSYSNIYNKMKKLSESKLRYDIFSRIIHNSNNVKKNETINDMKMQLCDKMGNETNNNITKYPVYIYRIKHQKKYVPIKNFKYSILFIKKKIYNPLIKYKFIPYFYYDYKSRNTGYILNSPFGINTTNLHCNTEKNQNFNNNYVSNNKYNDNFNNNYIINNKYNENISNNNIINNKYNENINNINIINNKYNENISNHNIINNKYNENISNHNIINNKYNENINNINIINNKYKINHDNDNENNMKNVLKNKVSFINKGSNSNNRCNIINKYCISVNEAPCMYKHYSSNFNNNAYILLHKKDDIYTNKKYEWKHLGRKIYAKGKIYINRNNHIINKYNKIHKYHLIRINNRMKNIRYNFFIYNIFKLLYKLSRNMNHKKKNPGEILNWKYVENIHEKNKDKELKNYNVLYKTKINNNSLMKYHLKDNFDRVKYLHVTDLNNLNFFEMDQNKKSEINNKNNIHINDLKNYDTISTNYLKKQLYKDTILKKKDKNLDVIKYNIKNIPKNNRTNNIELDLNNYYKTNEEILSNSNNLSIHKICSKNCILKNTCSNTYNNAYNNIYNTTNEINKNNLIKCNMKVKKFYFNRKNKLSQITEENFNNTLLHNKLSDNSIYNICNTNLRNVTLKNKNIESFHICSINSLNNKQIKNANYKHNIENICIYKDF